MGSRDSRATIDSLVERGEKHISSALMQLRKPKCILPLDSRAQSSTPNLTPLFDEDHVGELRAHIAREGLQSIANIMTVIDEYKGSVPYYIAYDGSHRLVALHFLEERKAMLDFCKICFHASHLARIPGLREDEYSSILLDVSTALSL